MGKGEIEALMDGFLEVAGGDGGGCGDGFGQFEGGGVEVLFGDEGVDEADFEGFGGGSGSVL